MSDMAKRKINDGYSAFKAPSRSSAMSVPSGSKNQQRAANDIFIKFLSNAQMSREYVLRIWSDMKLAESKCEKVPEFTIYWVLEEFAKFLFNYASSKVKNLLCQHLGSLDDTKCSQI
ncbi:hypothetical protein THRCLA_23455 [Thraustotheca clavata]|uniref:Uncharacterized protein n=1 Tax=Thraustotheca clavata TaxID=74557 RepID=A0A1V9Y4D8_9STRA|nr:hypothetical protein THRCLA_23455 [Thraustotheca clavata]